MGFFSSVGKIVVFGIIIIGSLAYLGVLTPENIDETTESVSSNSVDLKNSFADSYIEKIEFDNNNLRQLAIKSTEECENGDKDCQVVYIYRYVVNNYKYYSDPRNTEKIQRPEETINYGGGDCEDLTILLISLLENVGFKTYIVFTDDHAYSLVCGINPTTIAEYARIDRLKAMSDNNPPMTDKIIFEDNELFYQIEYPLNFQLEGRQTYYYGTDSDELPEGYIRKSIEYQGEFSGPLDFYVVPSKSDFEDYTNGNTFNSYTMCERKNILSIENKCQNLDKDAGIMLNNVNRKDVNINSKLTYKYTYDTKLFTENMSISSYKIDNENCVVLEATSGIFGYVGNNAVLTNTTKTAIDPVTRKEEILS